MDKKDFFNSMAAGWDEKFYSPELIQRLDEMVVSFGLSRGDYILDVGCGTGGLIPSILKAVGPSGEIQAIDFAGEMVKRARKKFEGHTNVSIKCASVEDIPFDALSFDHVLCFGCFPHFDHKEKALNEMHRVLKQDGKLFIAHALSSEELKAHHQGAAPVANDILPEEPEMKKMMAEAGFKNISIVDKAKCYICQGAKDLSNYQ